MFINKKNQTKGSAKVTALITILVIVLLIVFTGTMTLYHGKYAPTVVNSIEAADKIREAQKNGGEVYFSQEECNELIKIYFNKYFNKGTISVRAMEANIEGDSLIIKAPVNIKGINILLSTKGTLTYTKSNPSNTANNSSSANAANSGSLNFIPANFKAGLLYIPKNLVMKELSKYIKDITAKDGSIAITADKMPFQISSASVKDGKLYMNVKKYESKGLFDDKLTALNKAKDELTIMESQTSSETEKKKIQSAIEEINKAVKQPEKIDTKVIEKVDDKLKEIANDNKNAENKKQAEDIQQKLQNTQEEKKKASLQRVGGELSSAMAAVKTPEQKQIIASMQSTIYKMIQNPSYNYQGDASVVKSMYRNLPNNLKNEVKSAILYNVDASTMMDLKDAFGL